MKNYDSTRQELKELGWKREDRTNQGITKELWVPPWDGIGMRPISMSYESALRRKDGKVN